jgi:cadherin-related family protein 3
VIPGFPLIINSSPFTEAFRVNRLSGTDFEVSNISPSAPVTAEAGLKMGYLG